MEFRGSKGGRGSRGGGKSSRDSEDPGGRYASGGGKPGKEEGGRGGRRRRVEYERSGYKHGRSEKASSEEPKDRDHSDTRTQSENLVLSNIIRKVIKEEEYDRRLSVQRQLRDFQQDQNNHQAVLNSSEQLLTLFLDMLHERGLREIKTVLIDCLVELGCTLTEESDRYIYWTFLKLQQLNTIEVKAQLLSILNKVLNHKKCASVNVKYIQMAMNRCQKILENAENSPDMLMGVVDIIKTVAKKYPECFVIQFKDIVDILVGWHIDPDQKSSVTEYTSEALIGFYDFWSHDPQFSISLLSQFVEDTEAYAEDLAMAVSGSADDDVPSPEQCAEKCSALIKVFTTVVKGYLHENNKDVDKQEFAEIMCRLIKCVERMMVHCRDERFLTAANQCIETMMVRVGSEYSLGLQSQLIYLIVTQCCDKSLNSHPLMDSILVLISRTIEHCSTQLPADFLTQLIGPESIVPGLCLCPNKQILDNLLTVYKMIVGLKSVPLLQSSYRLLMARLEVAYNKLLIDSCSESRCSLITSVNPFSPEEFSVRDAEIIVTFSICVLAEIGNAKSNIIAMWALDPSIFNLLSDRLMPLNTDLMTHYPAIHYALIETLSSHCSRHGHFAVSSYLVTGNSGTDGASSLMMNTASSKHLSTVLNLISDMLCCESMPFDCLVELLRWCFDLTDSLIPMNNVYSSSEFKRLTAAIIVTGFNPLRELTIAACDILKLYFKNVVSSSSEILVSCVELCAIRISDSDTEISQNYFDLLTHLPLSVSTRCASSLVGEEEARFVTSCLLRNFNGVTYRTAARGHMSKIPNGNFHTHNFTAVMAYILQNEQIQLTDDSDTFSWLERHFDSCQRWDPETKLDPEPLQPVIQRNQQLLWFWAAWEAAQFCIMAKLRTPLGKPQDTFTAIEAAVKQYAQEVRVNQGEESGDILSVASHDDVAGDRGHNVRTLLMFMEHLEKHLHSASEGCATVMTNPPKVVRTFFRTNRSTCVDWLSRLRLNIILIARHCHEPATVVRHCCHLLPDILEGHSNAAGDFDSVLVFLVESLCELRAYDSLHGLYMWVREATGRKFTWIKSAIDMAAARYEIAADGYKMALSDYLNADSTGETEDAVSSRFSSPAHGKVLPPKVTVLNKNQSLSEALLARNKDSNVVRFLSQQVGKCYERLGCWEEVMRWQESLESYRNEHTGTFLQKSFTSGQDPSFIKAMTKFSVSDLTGAQQILNGDEEPDRSLEVVKRLGSWGYQDVVERAERMFWSSALNVCSSEASQSEIELMQKSRELCEGLLAVSTVSWPTLIHQGAMIQLSQSASLLELLNADSLKPESLLTSLSKDNGYNTTDHDVSIPLRSLNMIKLIEAVHNQQVKDHTLDISSHVTRLSLTAAKLARKQNNYRLCSSLLYGEHLSRLDEDMSALDHRLVTQFSKLHISPLNIDEHLCQKVMTEVEGSKLLYARSLTTDAIEGLSSTIVRTSSAAAQLTPSLTKTILLPLLECSARATLTLTKWLQADVKYSCQLSGQVKQVNFTSSPDPLIPASAKMIKNLLDFEAIGAREGRGLCRSLETGDDNQPDSEIMIGRLLHLSTMHSPSLAKSWFSLAGWCYRNGRKVVDSAISGSVELTMKEKSIMMSMLPDVSSSENIESVISVLGHIHTGGIMAGEEDIGDQDQSLFHGGDDADLIRRKLMTACPALQPLDYPTLPGYILPSHSSLTSSSLEGLVMLWKTILERIYHYYKLSAAAYFTFLQINGQCQVDVNVDGNVTATLRLLRLLVKHAVELRDVLEAGFKNSPTAPWKSIVPQLFSRLNHPEPYVHQSVCELLCRVAVDSPHIIVYPAVVGLTSSKDLSANKQTHKDVVGHTSSKDLSAYNNQTHKDGFLNEYLSMGGGGGGGLELGGGVDVDDDVISQDDDSGECDVTSINTQQTCFKSILDVLSNSSPKMITEVQLLVSELRRITLLWDELWAGALAQMYQDVARRIKQLETELSKVNTYAEEMPHQDVRALVLKKHRTILKPVYYTMERLLSITGQTAQTQHELWFQSTYTEVIKSTIEAIKNPANPFNPTLTWNQFKQLHNDVQQRLQKRTGQLLNMQEISSSLSNLHHTSIAMPGLCHTDHVITIESIHNSLQILPTKTKPKKLLFVGSDGVRYSYLFKGLEDLHLDERIMQFLSIVNNMFIKTGRESTRSYRARHYSVTPLGVRSGLIQWVNGATPAFTLYKRWQQRELSIQQSKQQQQTSGANQAAATGATGTVLRPSELFYGKLNPLLKEQGISSENRKDWPLSVLRTVLEELMAETPKDLLAKELWCSSTSTFDWWLMTQTYARSTAVMSMIGYIIGLGDRHLDNILVDLRTGEVVHIDYNVCFEKGKTLRVPEKVPFRMSQNFETPLGLTGVEGTFRVSCEYVMKAMRRGRETLLTLLEAFVYDPLVDWTMPTESNTYTGIFYEGLNLVNDEEERKSRKDLEHEMSVDMLSVRMAEMRSAWIKNRDDMLTSLQQLDEFVCRVVQCKQDEIQQIQQLELLQQQISYLTAAKQNTKHPLYNLTNRYKKFSKLKKYKTEAVNAVQSQLHIYEHHTASHRYSQDAMRGPDLQRLSTSLTERCLVNALPDSPAVVEFLQGAGQGHLVTEFEQSLIDLQKALVDHRSHAGANLDMLLTYSTIVSRFPRWLEEYNCVHILQQFLQELISDFTVERLEKIETERNIKLYMLDKKKKQGCLLSMESDLSKAVTQTEELLHRLMQMRRNISVESTDILSDISHTKRNTIIQYIKGEGSQMALSMTGVLINELSVRASQVLQLEISVKDTDTGLLSMKLDDTAPWFADLMLTELEIVSLITDLLNLLPNKDETASGSIGERNMTVAVKSAHGIYTAIQDLLHNLRIVILPETCSALQTSDSSVVEFISILDQLIDEVDVDKISLSPEQFIETVNSIKVRLNEQLQPREEMGQSKGRMLFMGFIGLFQHLEAEVESLITSMQHTSVPENWCKIDAIFTAIKISSDQPKTRTLVNSVMFVKQLKVMSEFFHLCKNMSHSFLGLSETNDYVDEDNLLQPVRSFICDYVKSTTLGSISLLIGYTVCHYIEKLHFDLDIELDNLLSSSAVESSLPAVKLSSSCLFIMPHQLQLQADTNHVTLQLLGQQAVERCLHSSSFTADDYSSATQLLSEAINQCIDTCAARMLDRSAELNTYKLKQMKLQLMRFQWLHEDVVYPNIQAKKSKAPKYSLMSDLKKITGELKSIQNDTLVVSQSRYLQVEKAILQRMKWAVGANPSLSHTLLTFEQTLNRNSLLLEVELSCGSELIEISKGVLHYELTASKSSETNNEEQKFLELMKRPPKKGLLIRSKSTLKVKHMQKFSNKLTECIHFRCREFSLMERESEVVVSEVEETLMKSLTSKEINADIHDEWIRVVLAQIEQKIQVSRDSLQLSLQLLKNSEEHTKQQVNAVWEVLKEHHRLMSDLRVILKAIAKDESGGRMRQYLTDYKEFSESFSLMLKSALNEASTHETYSDISQSLAHFMNSILRIYNDLVDLAPPISEDSNTAVSSLKTAAFLNEDFDVDPSAAAGSATAVATTAASATTTGSAVIAARSAEKGHVIKAQLAYSASKASLASASGAKEKITRDPRTGKAVQERNSYAVNVWRKVKSKLDGRESDSSSKRLSVAEQVDIIIKEAKSLDNLAALYEGWTPWV